MSDRVPDGFRLAGVHCGIKQDPVKEDLTLLSCDAPSVAAGVYTTNLMCAAPVAFDRERTPSEEIRAVVVNSRNPNACTGEQGTKNAREMARLAARACGADERHVLVMSTGVIGEQLPMAKIAAGIDAAAARLGNDEASLIAAARGILTTDNSHKLAGRELTLSAGPVRVTGMAKGAGMIGPRMATMLGLILTDARLAPGDAQAALSDVAEDTFNCVSVEGHMSTNDTVLLLASGAAAASALAGSDLALFRDELADLCTELARAIPADGEGATHLITVEVQGCAARDDAFRIAKTVADSPLVKTAVAGGDPNWGRIVSAAGYAGVRFDPTRVDLHVNDVLLYEQGTPAEFDAAAVSTSMRENFETHVVLRLTEGNERVRFYTSDLTVEYVRFNADYHT